MKKIGIMQPYFLPYPGYFSLIKHTDEFILFDTPQFMRHGWIERNRILKQGDGWLYIKAPLQKHGQLASIKDVQIDNTQPWADKLLSQLVTYKKIAPYYKDVVALLESVLKQPHQDVVSLNKDCLQSICTYLDISVNLNVFSEMNLEIVEPKAADEWALNICQAIGGVSEYWNPPGGEEFFDRSKYDQAGIRLVFQKIEATEYNQKREPFEPHLSIVDMMMFNAPEEINTMLDRFVTA